MKEHNAVRAFSKAEHGIVAVERGFLFAAMIVLVFSIVIQVICRYVLKVSSPWCEELARYLFIAMTFIGSATAFASGGHIGIDLVDTVVEKHSKQPEKIIGIFNKLAIVITIAFMLAFSIFYFDYLLTIGKHPQTSANMKINMLIPMSSILIGSVLMVYHNVCRFFYPYEPEIKTE
ncbi:MAG: TRAP transporter small permease [Angelakisella sp.]